MGTYFFLLKQKNEPNISSVIYTAEKTVTDVVTVTDDTVENTDTEIVEKNRNWKGKIQTSLEKKGNSNRANRTLE